MLFSIIILVPLQTSKISKISKTNNIFKMAESAGPSTKSFAALNQSRENKRKIAGNGNNDNMTYAAGRKALKRLKQSKVRIYTVDIYLNLDKGHKFYYSFF